MPTGYYRAPQGLLSSEPVPVNPRHVDNTLGTTASGNNALWGIDGAGNSVLRPSYQFGLDANGNVTQTEISPTYNNGNHFAGTGRNAFDRNSVPMSDQGYAALMGAGLPIATDRDVLGGGAFGARAWANQHPGGVIGAFGAAALGGALAAGYGGAAGGAGAGAGSGAGSGAGTGAAAGTGATAGTAGTAAGTAGTAAGTAGAVGAPAGIEGVTVVGSSGAGAGAGAAGAGAGIGGSAAFWDSVNQGASDTSATNAQNERDLQNMDNPAGTDWQTWLQRANQARGLLAGAGAGEQPQMPMGGGLLGGGSGGAGGPRGVASQVSRVMHSPLERYMALNRATMNRGKK
jgi:hypothetical protein